MLCVTNSKKIDLYKKFIQMSDKNKKTSSKKANKKEPNKKVSNEEEQLDSFDFIIPRDELNQIIKENPDLLDFTDLNECYKEMKEKGITPKHISDYLDTNPTFDFDELERKYGKKTDQSNPI